MKNEYIKDYLGKKVKILLKNKFLYTCIITDILEDSIRIKDKFGNLIIISSDEISLVTELNGGGRDDKRY